MNSNYSNILIAALFAACVLSASTGAQTPPPEDEEPVNPRSAGVEKSLPVEFRGLATFEQLDQPLPLDLKFRDSQGRPVTLGDYFKAGRPVILTLNYFRCPMLCGLQLNGMLDGLREISLVPGEDYEIVTVSFDPFETPDLAASKKKNYVEAFGDSAAARGWHFLTGPPESVKGLLEATGIKIRWSEERQEWIHEAVMVLCTPDGRIGRYLYGITHEPRTLRLSLVETSEGKIGTTIDHVLLFCLQFSGPDGAYMASVERLLRFSAGFVVVIVGTFLGVLWRRDYLDRRRRGSLAAGESGGSEGFPDAGLDPSTPPKTSDA